MTEDKIDIISKTMLFQGLDMQEIGRISQITVDRYFDRGESIFLDGDESNGFYIIVDGFTKIYKVSSEGKEQILHIFGPGEPFGEVPVFSGRRFPANAETITKAYLLFVPRSSFINLITETPLLALNMIAVLSARLRKFTSQIEAISLKEVPARLAGYLVYLAEEQKDMERVTLAISKGQLASLLGTVPETLSRVFAKMNSHGLIEVNDREIRFLDFNGLQSLADSGRYGE